MLKHSFIGCDFTYGDRGVNCYSHDDIEGGLQTVSFTDCTFTATNEKSFGAVEINSCYFSVGIKATLVNCTAPAYGELAYISEYDTFAGEKTTLTVDGEERYVVLVGNQWASAADNEAIMKKALAADKKAITVILAQDTSIDIGTGWGMGGANTESISINGNGNKLTLSSTYRSYFKLANPDGVLYLNDMALDNLHEKTHFFDYTTHFCCETVATNVDFVAAALVDSGVKATFNDCAFNEPITDGYGLWIMSGADVTLNGGVVNSERGFKIADEDSAAAKTTLSVSGTDFNNIAKAAILVTTKHGADITLNGLDISDCAADSTNAVWLDEDRLDYKDTVTVTGGSIIDEP